MTELATGGTVACEVTMDGSLFYVIQALRDSEGIVRTRMVTARSFREVDTIIHRDLRPATVLAPGLFRDRLSRLDRIVGSSDLGNAMPVFFSTITDGRLRHPDDPRLSEQMLMAVQHSTKAGQQTLIAKDGRSLGAVRALLWAVAQEAEQRSSRPRLRVAR